MRIAITLTFVICGTSLVLAPAAHDYLMQRSVNELLVQRKDLHSISAGRLTDGYRLFCGLIGTAMIGAAGVMSLRMPRVSHSGIPATA